MTDPFLLLLQDKKRFGQTCQPHNKKMQFTNSSNRNKKYYWHVTLKEWVDWPTVFIPLTNNMLLCHEVGEVNAQKHTHIGLDLTEKKSFKEMIALFQQEYTPQAVTQIRIDSHASFDTIIGYHTGRGAKPACSRTNLKFYKDFDLDEWEKAHPIGKKPKQKLSDEERQAKNDLLLKTPTTNLVEGGQISLLMYDRVEKNKGLYSLAMIHSKNLKTKVNWWPWQGKKRHLFMYAGSSKGKSAFVKALIKTYGEDSFYIWDNNQQFQDNYCGQQFLVMEEMSLDNFKHINQEFINLLCDGSRPIPLKGVKAIKSHSMPILIITSNRHPSEAIRAFNAGPFETRFNLVQQDELKDLFAKFDWTLEELIDIAYNTEEEKQDNLDEVSHYNNVMQVGPMEAHFDEVKVTWEQSNSIMSIQHFIARREENDSKDAYHSTSILFLSTFNFIGVFSTMSKLARDCGSWSMAGMYVDRGIKKIKRKNTVLPPAPIDVQGLPYKRLKTKE